MLKADVALRGGGERAVRLRLLRQVEQLEHAAGGRLGVLQVAEAACDLLQRAGELLGIQQDRHDNADGHALIADDEPAAEQADGDVGQRIREGDERPDDGRGEIGPCLGLAATLVQLGVALLCIILEVIGFCRGKVRKGLLRHGVEVAGLREHAVEVLFTAGGQERRQQDGGRGEHKDDGSQPPVFQQHHDGDGKDHEKAGHERVDDLVNVVSHGGHVVHHARENVADGRLIHIAHGQAADFIRDADAQLAGEVAADDPVEQLHLDIAEQAIAKVDQREPAHGAQETRQQVAAVGAVPPGIQPVDEAAEQLRAEHAADDHADAQQRGEQEPLPDRAGLPEQAADDMFLFRLFHWRSPPVCEA